MKKSLVQPLRSGVAEELEELADMMLMPPSMLPKKWGILSPWRMTYFYRREVYNDSGVADPSVRLGMYHRAKSGKRWLNSRDGIASRGGRRDLNRKIEETTFLNHYEYYEIMGTTERGTTEPFTWGELVSRDEYKRSRNGYPNRHTPDRIIPKWNR